MWFLEMSAIKGNIICTQIYFKTYFSTDAQRQTLIDEQCILKPEHQPSIQYIR